MRPNQQNNNNKNNNNRSRGRNGGRKHVNPLSRNFESNGPDVKVRGNAAHIAEKYMQLARDAQSSGDSVMAENYLQHAEHYFRIVSAAQPQNGQMVGDEYDDDMPEPNSRFSSPVPQQQQSDQDGDEGDGQQQPPQQNNNNQQQPRQDREQRDNREFRPRENRTRPASERPVAVIAAEPVATEEVAEAPIAEEAIAADGEQRKVRERRPRRRRPTTEGGDPANAPQPDMGELPAFITAGGVANAE